MRLKLAIIFAIVILEIVAFGIFYFEIFQASTIFIDHSDLKRKIEEKHKNVFLNNYCIALYDELFSRPSSMEEKETYLKKQFLYMNSIENNFSIDFSIYENIRKDLQSKKTEEILFSRMEKCDPKLFFTYNRENLIFVEDFPYSFVVPKSYPEIPNTEYLINLVLSCNSYFDYYIEKMNTGIAVITEDIFEHLLQTTAVYRERWFENFELLSEVTGIDIEALFLIYIKNLKDNFVKIRKHAPGHPVFSEIMKDSLDSCTNVYSYLRELSR